MKLRMIAMSIFIAVLLYLMTAAVYAAPDISVIVNGEVVQFTDVDPVIYNNRVYVPLRAVLDVLHAKSKYFDKAKAVNVTRGEVIISLQVNNNKVTIGQVLDKERKHERSETIDAPPIIVNDRLLIPIRFVLEPLNIQVSWNAATQSVIITDSYIGGVKFADAFYGLYPEVPDFGKITSAELIETDVDKDGAFYTYDVSEVASFEDYLTALNINGYGYDEEISDTISDYLSYINQAYVEYYCFINDKGTIAGLLVTSGNWDLVSVHIPKDTAAFISEVGALKISSDFNIVEMNQTIELNNYLTYKVTDMTVADADGASYFNVTMDVRLSDLLPADNEVTITQNDFWACADTETDIEWSQSEFIMWNSQRCEYPFAMSEGQVYTIMLSFKIPKDFTEIAFVALHEINDRPVGDWQVIYYNR